jgi:hypothetical protein
MSEPRLHLEDSVGGVEAVQKAFATLGAILLATNGNDVEADFEVEGVQFHLEVSRVNEDMENE